MHRSGPSSGSTSAGQGSSGKIAGLYDLEETLGSGHFAVVKLARHVFTGEKVAVKVIDKTKLDDISRSHLFQEVRCMKLVQHPNVVRLYEVIDTQTKLYLILELGDGGDLYEYIIRHESGLTENLARDYFKQIVRAISYCHRLHVVHRDLKPENVVFFEKLGIVKLTDFGFSNKFCPGQKLETSCGSLAYSAPEILLGDSYDAPAVDIWSLGVILYMLVCGNAPFHEANDSETLTMIMDCKYTIPQHVSPECRNLISRMLVREPDKRANLSQIASDPWLHLDNGSENGNSAEGLIEDSLPLVSQKQLCEDDHALVIQKMVNGHIASKEQILEALDKNEYNHITATYYLLAERKLRSIRQKQTIVQRPEVLGVNLSDAGTKKNFKVIGPQSNRLVVPAPATGTLLGIPRTPGDAPQRSRKCSIVREEEDDDEACGTRRGSRSEGRLHLALQERIPSTLTIPSTNALLNLETQNSVVTTISKVNQDDENTRKRLGDPGMGMTSGWMSFGKKNNCVGDQNRPKSAIEQSVNFNNTLPLSIAIPKIVKTPPNYPEESIIKNLTYVPEDKPSVAITTIHEAATISIPIRVNVSQANISPVYKTMPSPGKPLKPDVEVKCKPLPVVVPVVKPTEIPVTSESTCNERRSKHHKSNRTISCSSSDASDDDSENRKKRPPKNITTPTHKPISQRRDSHDDSSDSQEQGASTGSASGSSSRVTQTSNSGGNGGTSSKQSKDTGDNNSGGSLSRRHRGGRRACETRLRESQSLNRITEVQEADAAPIQAQRGKGFFHPTRLFHGFGRRPVHITSEIQNAEKFNHNNATGKMSQGNFNTSMMSQIRAVSEEKENCHKMVNITEKHGFKKVKIFSRYFQVHKKLCLPRLPTFPRLWGRTGRLYKAQSCGSIVRDKITSAGASSLLLVNELCRDKPIVMDSHRARIKLLAEMTPCNGHNAENIIDINSPQHFTICQVHLSDPSKCCGMC